MNMQIETLSVAALLENVTTGSDSLFPWDFGAHQEWGRCVVQMEGHRYRLFVFVLPRGEVAWLVHRDENIVRAGIVASMCSALAAAEVAVATWVRPRLRLVDENNADQ
jgi:hypothetical protein